MKKIILLALLISISGSAQGIENSKETQTARLLGNTFRNPLVGKDKPKGSPYSITVFMPAKVESVTDKAIMRYNVYNDEFEFITPKNDTLILDKIADFGNIAFAGKKYNLVTYTNTKGKLTNGYLIDFYSKGNFILYKKENVTFYEARPAKTSLESSLPAKYVKADDTFFLKTKENGIVEFPDSKKGLIKLFPTKKTEIENFVKENKILFNEDTDRIRILDFLATL